MPLVRYKMPKIQQLFRKKQKIFVKFSDISFFFSETKAFFAKSFSKRLPKSLVFTIYLGDVLDKALDLTLPPFRKKNTHKVTLINSHVMIFYAYYAIIPWILL